MRSLTVRQHVQQEMVGPLGELHALYQIYRYQLLLLMYFLRGILRPREILGADRGDGHVSLLGVLEIGRLEPVLEY
jgi:hypothetical protein